MGQQVGGAEDSVKRSAVAVRPVHALRTARPCCKWASHCTGQRPVCTFRHVSWDQQVLVLEPAFTGSIQGHGGKRAV